MLPWNHRTHSKYDVTPSAAIARIGSAVFAQLTGDSPILFSCYISPISFIANTFGVGIQQYADDTQLYVSPTPTDMHARQSLLTYLLCTVGFVTMAFFSIARNLNLF